MKALRQCCFLLGLWLLVQPLLHAQNPYERLGVKSDPLTLSQGRYQEFFSNDTLVQIGSVIFNTITQEVVGFVEPDSSGLDFPADVASRWLSPDPLAAKYPEMSPYVGMGNNPVIFIDPNGREVYLVIDGKAHQVTRESLKTGNSTLEKAISVAISTEGNYFGKYLENSDHDIYLTMGATTLTLPNASNYNTGSEGQFQLDRQGAAEFFGIPEEQVELLDAFNGADLSESEGKSYSFILLDRTLYEEGVDDSELFLFIGLETNKENKEYEGAFQMEHEAGAHIDSRNNPQNPGNPHLPNLSDEDYYKGWEIFGPKNKEIISRVLKHKEENEDQ